MKPRMRQALIYGALLATGLAALFAPSPPDTVRPVDDDHGAVVNKPAERVIAAPALAAATAVPTVTPAALMAPKKRVALAAKPRDLFHIEAPPPPPVARAEPVPPPPPMAPPLPYVYMGKSVEQSQVSVFLTRNDKPYVARQGDVLDGQYRIDAINPPVMELTYLPLAQKQTLNIGAIK